jgi:hypothetical protein
MTLASLYTNQAKRQCFGQQKKDKKTNNIHHSSADHAPITLQSSTDHAPITIHSSADQAPITIHFREMGSNLSVISCGLTTMSCILLCLIGVLTG